MIKGKVAPFITTGISTNVFLYSRNIVYLTYADGHHGIGSSYISFIYDYYRVNPQLQLGGGLDITFKKSRLRILPIARVSFLSDNKSGISEYLSSVGVGVSYLFGI